MENFRRDLGFNGYYISREVDLSKIRAQHAQIEELKNGQYACFIKPFLTQLNNLVNLDYVIKSDKLEHVDYGDIEDELKDIKYALITQKGILAFEVTSDMRRKRDRKETINFKNNIDFQQAFSHILKNQDSKIRIISFEELRSFYKKTGIMGSFKAYMPTDKLIEKTNLIFINPSTRELKVLPNKNHMIALDEIIEMAQRSKTENAKLSAHSLEKINNVLFKGTEHEGQTGFGKFRETNVMVGYPPMWETVVLREVTRRDDLGNPRGYNNKPLLDQIDQLFTWYNGSEAKQLSPLERAAILNLEISRLQPFRDGNKRVARLFTNYEILKNDYPTIAFRAGSKIEYDERLARCINSKDITEFVEYLVDMLYLQQNIYLNELKIMAYYLSDDLSQENAHEDEIIEK